jgi:hypothetical protein
MRLSSVRRKRATDIAEAAYQATTASVCWETAVLELGRRVHNKASRDWGVVRSVREPQSDTLELCLTSRRIR